MIPNLPIKPISNWKQGHKFLSTQIGAIGTFVTSMLVLIPDTAYDSWLALPVGVRSIFPEHYMPMIGVVIFVASMVARFIRQTKLQGEPNAEHQPERPFENH